MQILKFYRLTSGNRHAAVGALLVVLGILSLPLLLLAALQPAGADEGYAPEVVHHLSKGNDFLRKGELGSAQQEFDQALKLDPKCYQAHNNLGLCYMRNGMLDKAADQFRLALKINPAYVNSLNNLGAVTYRQGHLEEASIFYQQALSLAHNEDPEIQTNLANVLRDKGDYATAIDHYRQSIKLKPDYAPAYNNLGLTLLRLHRENEAAVEVTKAIKLKPHYSEAYYDLGLINKALNKLPEAKVAFEQSLKYESNPTYAEDTRKLIRELSVPKSADEHLNRGYDLLEQNDWQKAESEFRAAIKVAPGNAIAWNNLGLALASQKRSQEATNAYNKAILLKNGRFAAARYNLGQALRDSGNNAAAEKSFRQAIKDANGTHALAHVALGVLLKEKGDLNGAVQNYKLAILQSGDTLPVVHYNLALALEKMESAREAVREYQIYLAQSPRGLNAEGARQRLRRLGVD